MSSAFTEIERNNVLKEIEERRRKKCAVAIFGNLKITAIFFLSLSLVSFSRFIQT